MNAYRPDAAPAGQLHIALFDERQCRRCGVRLDTAFNERRVCGLCAIALCPKCWATHMHQAPA
jgi:hypothetical protein